MAKTYNVTCKVSIPRAGEFEVTIKVPDNHYLLSAHPMKALDLEDAAWGIIADKIKVKVLNASAVLKQIKKYRESWS